MSAAKGKITFPVPEAGAGKGSALGSCWMLNRETVNTGQESTPGLGGGVG